MATWLHLLYNWSYLIKFCWWCHGSKLLHQNFTSELLLNVAEDNHYCVFFSLAIWVFSFVYFIDFGYFIIFFSEEQSYLFILILIAHDSFFCLSYFTLWKLTINTVTCFFPSYIQWAVLPEKLLHQNFTSELLLNVAEDNHYCLFLFFSNLSIFIHLFYRFWIFYNIFQWRAKLLHSMSRTVCS